MAAGESKSVLFVCLGERGRDGRSRSVPAAPRPGAPAVWGGSAVGRGPGPREVRHPPSEGSVGLPCREGRSNRREGRQKAEYSRALFVIGTTRKGLALRAAEHWNRLPRVRGVSLSRDVPNPPGRVPV